jgi:hypothetical protein
LHENRLVFKLLVNKNSIRSIARVAKISPKAVYDKIDPASQTASLLCHYWGAA